MAAENNHGEVLWGIVQEGEDFLDVVRHSGQ